MVRNLTKSRLAALLFVALLFGFLANPLTVAFTLSHVLIPAASASAAGVCGTGGGWQKTGEPTMSLKGAVQGNALATAGGERSTYIANVTYSRGIFTIWFQDIGFRQIPVNTITGFSYVEGDTHELNALGFAAFIHESGQLKISVLHFQGNYPGTETGVPDRQEYVINTGYTYCGTLGSSGP